MDLIIKVNKNSIKVISIALIVILLLSCSVNRILEREKELMSITFGSTYENEKLTLFINDSIYYSDKIIQTNSLGIDPRSFIEIAAEKIHLKGVFTAKISSIFEEGFSIRKLQIDTVLYRNKGHRIIIGANYDKYYVSQQRKKFILD